MTAQPSITLRKAIEAHIASLPDPLGTDTDSPPELQALMAGHDACHALFGCSGEIDGEFMIDTWTLMGTDMTLRRYLRYLQDPAVAGLLRETGYARMLWGSLLAMPKVLRVIWSARRMKRPWRFDDHAAHLDRPLDELRAELGITVVQ